MGLRWINLGCAVKYAFLMIKLAGTMGLVVLLLLSSKVLHAQSVRNSHSQRAVGKLSGVVFDSGAARVPGAKIIIEAEGFRQEIVSTDDGSYEIDLPTGAYTVTARGAGFYPSRNCCVQIQSDAHTTLNLFIKGILIGEDLVPFEELRTETGVPNTTIQLRKLQDKA